eukprot:scaffold100271_cov48-Phaeocystis_antarctica.AAC.1
MSDLSFLVTPLAQVTGAVPAAAAAGALGVGDADEVLGSSRWVAGRADEVARRAHRQGLRDDALLGLGLGLGLALGLGLGLGLPGLGEAMRPEQRER